MAGGRVSHSLRPPVVLASRNGAAPAPAPGRGWRRFVHVLPPPVPRLNLRQSQRPRAVGRNGARSGTPSLSCAPQGRCGVRLTKQGRSDARPDLLVGRTPAPCSQSVYQKGALMSACRAVDKTSRCQHPISYDGLWCETHYRRYKARVKAGETTWERLAAGKRRVRRSKRSGGANKQGTAPSTPVKDRPQNVGIYRRSEAQNTLTDSHPWSLTDGQVKSLSPREIERCQEWARRRGIDFARLFVHEVEFIIGRSLDEGGAPSS
jgi:hypothetical protein